MKTVQSLVPGSPAVNVSFSGFIGIAKRFCQALIGKFSGDQELKVWETADSAGRKLWHAYDPISGRLICTETEAEMRVWLEQRYYQ